MTSEKIPVAVSWSTGKDSALGLMEVLEDERFEVKVLYTNFSSETGRSSIHGLEEDLADIQVKMIDLPFEKFFLEASDMEEYREELKTGLEILKEEYGVKGVVHSDIFLESAKEEKEEILQSCELEGIWPLWEEDTSELIERFDEEFKGVIVCVDLDKGPAELVGRELTMENLSEFPDVDPCGEEGEFHSFVTDAPYFQSPVKIRKKDCKRRETTEGESIYQDLRPIKVDVFGSEKFSKGLLAQKLREKGFQAQQKNLEFKEDKEKLEEDVKDKFGGDIAVGHCFSGTILLETNINALAVDPPNLSLGETEIEVSSGYEDKILASEELRESYGDKVETIEDSKHRFKDSMEPLSEKLEEKVQNSSKLF